MNAKQWGGLLLAAWVGAFQTCARGGGGCLAQGTRVLTPDGPVAIEQLKAGDRVVALAEGKPVSAMVQGVVAVQPDEYVELAMAGRRLRLTAEHPVQVGPGVFRAAGELKAGDPVVLAEGTARIEGAWRVAASTPAFNLLVMPGGTFVAEEVILHNKGCFLPDTPILRADGSSVRISEVRVGERLRAFTTGGEVVDTTVRRIFKVTADGYYVVTTERSVLRVTAEHPFYVGGGTFKTVAALKPGDTVLAAEANRLRAQRIVAMDKVIAPTPVYNLQTDAPNTYFAAGIAVHNKGGGGGCFLPDTPILRVDGSSVRISAVQVGDRLRAFTTGGELVETTVREIYSAQAPEYFVLRAGEATLRVTAEHPFYIGRQRFKTVAALRPGDTVYAATASGLWPRTVQSIQRVAGPVEVFNLRTDAPNTFFANGLAVHNKGFSGGHRRGSSGGGKPWSKMSWWERAVMVGFGALFGLIWLVVISAVIRQKLSAAKSENLDYLFSRKRIEGKAAKTLKLLEFIAKVDPLMNPEMLKQVAQTTFLKLQECWEAREYAPMKPLLMPDLFKDHLRQINGMIRNHEINKMVGLTVEAIDLVNVRYTHKPNQREFTALFTASVKDYYVDDRTGAFLRGDTAKARFQEFWTFQLMDGQWLLREIEQTGESDILKDENFFEQFTDQGVKEVCAETAGQQGAEGPWLEAAVDVKADRTERLLNFLAQTDKLWNREAMLRRARQVFLDLKLTEEKGDPEAIPAGDLFPEVAASLKAALLARKEQGISVEYRNLCARKVELLLVRNYADNRRDEFTVRVSAHAQRIRMRSGYVLDREEYVTPFDEYLTFGRLDGQWKLKEIVPPTKGRRLVDEENVDEESSPEQLQWYYQQSRAVS